jgi:hypothetical protein
MAVNAIIPKEAIVLRYVAQNRSQSSGFPTIGKSILINNNRLSRKGKSNPTIEIIVMGNL